MDILIIGGTRFLGRALVNALKNNGHNITLFNRGETNPNLFPDLKLIKGDREGETHNLGEGQWDVVIDTCGYVPRIVRQSVDYLKDKVRQYVFISSISVYEESAELDRKETAQVIDLEDKETEDIMGSPNNYGGLKYLCEEAVRVDFEHTLIIRPGLIVGPHDPTNRFTYWPVRIRKGGAVLVPEDDAYPLQIIDVRDLAEFIVKQIEAQVEGVYNLTGPANPISLNTIFGASSAFCEDELKLITKSNEFLLGHEITPWMELPLWIPDEDGRGLMHVNIDKAINLGLKFRSLEVTIKDTLDWYDEIQGDEEEWNAGLAASKESNMLNS